jgi:hypothetical protein
MPLRPAGLLLAGLSWLGQPIVAEDAFQSPYGDDKTVDLFLRLIDSRPQMAMKVWQDTMRLAVLSNAIDPGAFDTAIERLEHGDSLDSIEATLRRMW